jgi:hypothetical protein
MAKSPYTAQQQMSYKPCGCDGIGNRPPGWILDKIAEEKRTGGYNVKASNICDIHHIARTKNGTCVGCEGNE